MFADKDHEMTRRVRTRIWFPRHDTSMPRHWICSPVVHFRFSVPAKWFPYAQRISVSEVLDLLITMESSKWHHIVSFGVCGFLDFKFWKKYTPYAQFIQKEKNLYANVLQLLRMFAQPHIRPVRTLITHARFM